MLPTADRSAEVVAAVHEFFNEAPADVVDISIGVVGGNTDVDVVVAGSVPGLPVTALANFVADRIHAPVSLELKVVEATTASAEVSEPRP